MASTAEGMGRSRIFGVLAAVATLFVFVFLLGLGTWQVQRLQWKEGLLATIDARIHAAPLPLADIEDRYPDIEYMPVTLSGSFLYEGERHFFTTWEGQSGFSVYTPLRLDNGDVVFVNRGFVPYDRKDAATRQEGQVAGEVEIVGLARAGLTERPSWIVPDNDPVKNVFYWKDIRAMAESAGLPASARVLPFFVDAGPAPNPGGLPIGGTTLIDLPNSHLQYALTWYGLAAVLAVMSGLWLVRRIRRRAPGA